MTAPKSWDEVNGTAHLHPFIGLHVIEVEPGTVVGRDDSGQDMIVTDTSAVVSDRKIWVTPKQYAAMKGRCQP